MAGLSNHKTRAGAVIGAMMAAAGCVANEPPAERPVLSTSGEAISAAIAGSDDDTAMAAAMTYMVNNTFNICVQLSTPSGTSTTYAANANCSDRSYGGDRNEYILGSRLTVPFICAKWNNRYQQTFWSQAKTYVGAPLPPTQLLRSDNIRINASGYITPKSNLLQGDYTKCNTVDKTCKTSRAFNSCAVAAVKAALEANIGAFD